MLASLHIVCSSSSNVVASRKLRLLGDRVESLALTGLLSTNLCLSSKAFLVSHPDLLCMLLFLLALVLSRLEWYVETRTCP